MSALPELNTLVRVALGGDAPVLPSRVEGVDGHDLLLAAPSYVGDVVGPKVGSTISVRWTSARGVCNVPVEFVGASAPASSCGACASPAPSSSRSAAATRGSARVGRSRWPRTTSTPCASAGCSTCPRAAFAAGSRRARLVRRAGRGTPQGRRRARDPRGVGLRTAPPVRRLRGGHVSFPEDHYVANLVRRFVLQDRFACAAWPLRTGDHASPPFRRPAGRLLPHRLADDLRRVRDGHRLDRCGHRPVPHRGRPLRHRTRLLDGLLDAYTAGVGRKEARLANDRRRDGAA